MCYNIDTNSRAQEVSMSIVRYTNKKTGWVSVYESTSNYDPVTKKSRPKRRYIGYEDPVSIELKINVSSSRGHTRHSVIDPSVMFRVRLYCVIPASHAFVIECSVCTA